MSDRFSETMKYEKITDSQISMKEMLKTVYDALNEKGYDPYDQIIGYILSGDPTYITSHNNARNMIRDIDREDLLKELLSFYLR
ncbi:MAG: IreB family regulatory phosphoprotein [Tissierellia bacterium]|nr:IreB family regulatory phosphoprotein [Tissierellia bacterium]